MMHKYARYLHRIANFCTIVNKMTTKRSICASFLLLERVIENNWINLIIAQTHSIDLIIPSLEGWKDWQI